MKPSRFSPDQEWFRDTETGEIYRLGPPDERGGWWDKVDASDLIGPDEKVHRFNTPNQFVEKSLFHSKSLNERNRLITEIPAKSQLCSD